MHKVYFGFALADSMFEGDVVTLKRMKVSDGYVRSALEDARLGAHEFVSCCNPSHEATIAAMRQRFELDVEIPATPPRVQVAQNDCVIVMGVRGLPRLTDRHEYTAEEIASATFQFHVYHCVDVTSWED